MSTITTGGVEQGQAVSQIENWRNRASEKLKVETEKKVSEATLKRLERDR